MKQAFEALGNSETYKKKAEETAKEAAETKNEQKNCKRMAEAFSRLCKACKRPCRQTGGKKQTSIAPGAMTGGKSERVVCSSSERCDF